MTVFLPRELYSSVTRTLVDSVAMTRSPFSGARQVQDWGGRAWAYDIEFAVHQGREGREVSAFFAQIGRANPFLLRDPSFITQASGAPVVRGGGQTGTTLLTEGWPANATVLRMGDAFQIGTGMGTRLHQLTADAVSGALGRATLSFVPALRYAPLAGDPLEVRQPAVLLGLAEPFPAVITKAELYRFSLRADEWL